MAIPGSVRDAAPMALAVTLACLWLCDGLGHRTASADSNGAPSSPERVQTVAQREPVPYPTVRKTTPDLREGATKTVRSGVNGERLAQYRVTYKNDVEVSRELVSAEVVRKPIPEVIYTGSGNAAEARGRRASRGYFSGRRVLTMVATGYDPSPASNGGTSRTSTGLRVGHGVVAVDPKFIPLGTKLFIEGYGYAVAADVGGAIRGNRIDLGHDNARNARNVGRRLVRVHILN